MGAVLASGTATAERPESPGATFTGPVIVLPIQARENSEASLHSPQATLFQGRKFR
jgi:hypothetical protein